MIDPKSLTQEDVGRWVVYDNVQKGRIKSWNDEYIFVVYSCAGEWDRFRDFTAAATKPEKLSFLGERLEVGRW